MHNKKGLKPINDVARHRIDELRKEAGMTQDVYGREVCIAVRELHRKNYLAIGFERSGYLAYSSRLQCFY
mgnify:CR=1 FL=1